MKKHTVFPSHYCSISTPAGVNITKLNVALFFVLIISFILSSPAVAEIYVEDFNYEKPDQNDFTNEVFHHNIMPIGILDIPVWDISDEWLPPSGNALDLWPAIDEITFDLAPGEYVNYASIEFCDYANSTIFEVTGTLGKCTAEIFWNGGAWQTANTSGQPLGQITMIRLISSEGAFDNLTINVLPEPATLLLFGFGTAFLRKRR